jgi:hypothetical protein
VAAAGWAYSSAWVCELVYRRRQTYPAKLRRTHATQLLNAGCRVTSIQKFLGHKRLNSTMIYARVHDRTVAEDYYAAMDVVEKRLEVFLLRQEGLVDPQVNDDERAHLLELAEQLSADDLGIQKRLGLVEQMYRVLNHGALPEDMQPTGNEGGRQPRAPP